MKNMKFYSKSIVVFIALFVVHGVQAQSRVFEVMYQGPGGIDKMNKKVLFAETKNISQDLNLAEIANRFGCKTLLGKAFILHHLEKPISPFDQSLTVQHRQDLIKFLVEHPEVLEQLENLIVSLLADEAAVIKFMQSRSVDSPTENPIAKAMRFMDKNKYAQIYSKWWSVRSLGLGIASLGGQGVKAWDSLFSDMSLARRTLAMASGFFGLSFDQFTAEQLLMANLWMSTIAGYSLYSHYTGALATRDALYSLNRLADVAHEIEALCKEHNIEHQFKLSSIRSDRGRQILKDLNQSHYKNKDTNFILSPIINTFMYEIYENDEIFAPIYASIGEIDAYVALAKKIVALQVDDHAYCFAQFLDQERPKIDAQDFWNILISKGLVVTNSLNESRNIILTGANEGGKTTTIRAILQNIVLAQTFGIAAAQEFRFTPFTKIHSYLNVSDDILSGKSRYAFELQQAKTILHQIEALQPEDKYFFVLDELFTGTNGEDGAQAAYDFIDNIASFSGIQFIYATHFNRLKQIGAANPACANYKIDPPLRNAKGEFIRDEQGQFIYPYTLSPGANNVNVALERAKDAGIFRKKVQN